MRPTLLPFIADIEASGFGASSYPIEIGLALNEGRRYCSLIKPASDWTHWDSSAEEVHNIPRSLLNETGKPARKVAEEINEILGNKTVYSDGWVVDEPWMIRLFDEAKLSRSFKFYDIQTILTEAQMDIWHQVKQEVILALHIPRHRASNDAQIIQQTYLQTMTRTERHEQIRG